MMIALLTLSLCAGLVSSVVEMKPKKVEPLPDFDSYSIDFDSDNKPECFHLFWDSKEVATVRLFYDSDGLPYRAVREDTRKQQHISLKELVNMPFFTAWIHSIYEIFDIKRIGKIESATIQLDQVKDGGFERGTLEDWIIDEGYVQYGRPSVSTEQSYDGKYSLKMPKVTAVFQRIPLIRSEDFKMNMMVYGTQAVSDTFLYYFFSDGTSEALTLDIAPAEVNTWAERNFNPTTSGKYITEVWMRNPLTDDLYVDSIKSTVLVRVSVSSLPTIPQSTKHDSKTYQTIQGGSAADGATVISNVANKVIKIHRLSIQSTVDGATDVYFYEETSGNQVTQKWAFNAREGAVYPFVSAPACIGQTTTVNKKVLLKNAAAKQINWDITYSVDDAS